MAIEQKTNDAFRSTRILYLFECAFENFISILVSGVYFAKLTASIGISDSMTAILIEITSLAALFQLITVIISHKPPFKRWVLPAQIIAEILFGLLYLIPLLKIGIFSSLLFFITVLISKIIKSITAPLKQTWFMSLVDDRKRGEYTSLVSIISRIGHIGFVFAIGLILDHFEKKDQIETAFIIFSVIIFILTALDTLSLILSKEKKITVIKKESSLKSIKNLCSNKKFVRIVILFVMSSLSSSMISSFLSTYQIKELGFSMTFIATFDTVITILGIPVLFFIGKLSRRFSYSKLLYVSFILKFVEFFMLAFTMPQNGAYLFTAYKVLAIFSGALDIVTVSNIIFDVVPYSERAAGLSLKAVFVGLTGFLTVLAVSPFLDYVQKNGNTFLGINAYAQQFLAASAGFIMLITIIYYHFFCKKLLEDTTDVSAE